MADLDTLCAVLGRARRDHDRAPDDERKYRHLLECEVAFLKESIRDEQRARAGEQAKVSALRRSLAKAERLLRSAATKPRKRARAAAPILLPGMEG